MSAARLYAIELDSTPVTVRATVSLPSARESAAGDRAEAIVHAVCGVPATRLELSDDEWLAIESAVITAEQEQRAAARESAEG